jgi:hypothetical protein
VHEPLKEGARHLNISTSRASTSRARLMEKFQLHSTAEVIRFARANEIVGWRSDFSDKKIAPFATDNLTAVS